ncbi:MAG: nuclear transport factor 2 family protein [Dehalococcoidia bacterium]
MVEPSDADAALAANQAFYSAFESLDIDVMKSAWDDEAAVTCVHPGWVMLRGWDDVMASWERIMDNATMMQFIVTDAEASVEGDWAWVTCTENLTSVVNAQVNGARVQTTNILHKRDGKWRLVHHHGSPVM